MSTLSVWRFAAPDGAEKAVATLGALSQQQLITVHDAATPPTPFATGCRRRSPGSVLSCSTRTSPGSRRRPCARRSPSRPTRE